MFHCCLDLPLLYLFINCWDFRKIHCVYHMFDSFFCIPPNHCYWHNFCYFFPHLSDGMYKVYQPSQISGQWLLLISLQCPYPSQWSVALVISETSEVSTCSVYSWLYDTAPERQTVCCNLWHRNWHHFMSVIKNH